MTSGEGRGTKRLAIKVHILSAYAKDVEPAGVRKATRAAFKAAGVPSAGALTVLVTDDAQIEQVASRAAEAFGQVDILVHAIAFANRDELTGPYYNTSRAGFHLAMDISVYSFTALARAFQPLLRPGGALLTLSYYGAEKVSPHYNVMGVAKAALEASVRYLAYDFGPQGVRVNAISAGPIRPLAAAGVSGFKVMLRKFAEVAPMRQNVAIEDVGGAAVFLCYDLASKTTGEVLYVDSGYNILGVTEPMEEYLKSGQS
jgi:enoyl-[acyl-carrier protein] reductase I